MLIGTTKSFIFVANTKTASTSVERALKPHADIHYAGTSERKHVPLKELTKLYPEVTGGPFGAAERERFFTFGVMRDPIDWIGSWYRYRKGNPEVHNPLPDGMTFEQFWARRDWNVVCANGENYLQRRLFCCPKGAVLADVIIPYERLDEMFGEICEGLGVKSPLPRRNVSRLTEFKIPEAMIEPLQKHYALDFELRSRLDEINEKGMAKLRARG
ncbi:sulfotransferase family 2 domain-containing protein [Marinovum sp. 2_MG-2023]|uniref:sulfotransferase family 2 domain-containing protein n=1 Tax=unclassified Marinovum TaxID=2647166 RepID=UPI0026E4927E|nr:MULTISPECIES: sulfotransferase family 2 domain-containing protein [unclassified Marinovum]MDO6732727.1 sulfotransferase family 2 domain-containing protein [Marinovum sp. 2_MG-2023]MDO6782001.1 sulfotransferase family 2 domain-containing protein [Marinovum sp. 1_MG-2023]